MQRDVMNGGLTVQEMELRKAALERVRLMPANIHVFDMLRKGTLEGMDEGMLRNELARVEKMLDAVNEYARLVAAVLAGRAERGPDAMEP